MEMEQSENVHLNYFNGAWTNNHASTLVVTITDYRCRLSKKFELHPNYEKRQEQSHFYHAPYATFVIEFTMFCLITVSTSIIEREDLWVISL